MMKMNQWLVTVGFAVVLCFGATQVLAQGGPGGGGGGGGGFGGGGQGGFGGGNFDPAARAQMMMDNYRQQLELANDDEWNAIKPMVQKVMDAQQETQAFGGRGGRGGGGGGGGGGRGGFGGTPNPTVTALQTAIDSGSTDQIKSALARYRDARKQAQDKLTAAQDALKAVLTVKQEAAALQLGLVN